MKKNGNNSNAGNYYIGLDVGTNSVGWAVTDPEYQLLKFKGNAMWGVRLFEEAQDASGRRSNRTARRRLARQQQRILLLQMLFGEEIAKKDPNFFQRMRESALHQEDKSGVKYALFADKDFTDREYHKQYPTAYHLRNELMTSDKEHDVRLVYLALHHIMKSRGHFLYETSGNTDEIMTLETAFEELCLFLGREYDAVIFEENKSGYLEILQNRDLRIREKKKALRERLFGRSEEEGLSLEAVSDLLAGATVSFCDLFQDETLKQAEIKSINLKNNLDDSFDALSAILGERTELLVQLKTVFDAARLSQILEGHGGISAAKIAQYEKNARDLKLLKNYVKETVPQKYKHVFSEKKDKLNNYAAYSRYHKESGGYVCTQEDFCKFLKSVLPEPTETRTEWVRIYREVQEGTFLPRLKGSDNGVIPYQLHRQELICILERASAYLPFLNTVDEDGCSVKEKIIKTFEFRLPYYVGPLNRNSPNSWVVRFAGKEGEAVRPWNFEKIVDVEASAGAFIENLIGLCTYTGEKVLPKDSLLYSEYMLRNEINLLRINGRPLPAQGKEKMIRDLFYTSRKKVTKKSLRAYLLTEGMITAEDEISGIDDTIKTTFRSYHDFRLILEKTGDYTMVESIIRSILVFGEDKKMLRRWLKKNTTGLDEEDLKHICRLKYADWGRLSETLLTGIKSVIDGEERSVMECLCATDLNLMQLMSSEFEFAKKAEEHRAELLGGTQSLTEKLDSLYVSPAVRRSLRQALRIVDEIVDIRKAAPAKIFIEMARGSREEVKNKRTESRKDKLLQLYAACREERGILFEKLQNEEENRLRSDKLYLYYVQLGKCMYTGEPINFESLATGSYDIDHIFPQSKIKDNSLDNRVLVRSELNREKTNIYPIAEGIRSKMLPTWTFMKKAGLISEKKFDRLSRGYPLTEKELSDFVARQLTETQQSTKALATLLKNAYGEKTRIVYSKAGNVSDFRKQFDLLKCRDVNDLHHAKDAYLNVVVGNVYDTRFTERFFANIRNEEYSLNRVFDFYTKGAWDKTETIKTVRHFMGKNNVLVTRMPYEVKGQLFDLQLMPAGKGQLEKKRGLSIEKYGGYNKLTGAYFCAVEYTDKKKRVRAIQPVYVYQKKLYETDPIRYCEEVLGLKEPKILCEKIRIDALLELDGKRLNVSGRTGNVLLCKHTYQLAVDTAVENYIRNLCKYTERCAARKAELEVTVHDGISGEENGKLYDWFLEKCDRKVYADLLKNMKADMVEHRGVFDTMTLLEQCRLLLEILKAFKCNAQNPDFSALCGKKTVAQIKKSMNLSNYSRAMVIHQSVTGLYETVTDLKQ